MGDVAAALVLLFLGLFVGIVCTVFDVLVIGSASFLAHISLFVLLNALLAVHVEDRRRAILWAAPLSLGYIESYFITTSATYEGFPKSLVVPLAATALIAPLLSYALWTAKNERNLFGRLLSLLVVVATAGMSYLINGTLTIYDLVVCLLIAVTLLLLPTRKLAIRRLSSSEGVPAEVAIPNEALEQTTGPSQPSSDAQATPRRLFGRRAKEKSAEEAPEQSPRREAQAQSRTQAKSPATPHKRAKRSSVRKDSSGRDMVRRQRSDDTATAAQKSASPSGQQGERRVLKPTKRTGGASNASVTRKSVRKRRAAEAAEVQEREMRRRTVAERRARQGDEVRRSDDAGAYDGYVSTLGTARTARPSTRTSRRGGRR